MLRGGIAARTAAGDAGFDVRRVRDAARAGDVEIVRRRWIATGDAPPDDLAAARAGGVVACVSAARRRGWWIPPAVEERLHLRLAPKAARDGIGDGILVHWTRAIVPVARDALLESIEDTLAHVARCLGTEDALIVWESAIRTEKLDLEALRRVRWPSLAARACADAAGSQADSGLETMVVSRVRGWGVLVRQQIVIAGRPVDLLIGARLITQCDGWQFHSSSAQRSADIAHDAELRLRGYTVLRFSYAQIIHDWPSVERTLQRAIAAGLHL
ncbi:hypothetical protein DC432_00025 [Microbacterium testaceum]|uniref:DUF559 domain-containing protein n=1 Tax=Microbacterium testaceum TaxID=2033 RepID=A0A2T7WXV1_MICTE|nr:hypothetical protein DC432_00025 [Microbacterium testaceum]